MALFEKSSLFTKSMKAQVIVGVVLLSVAAIMFGIGLPVLNILRPCFYYTGNCSHGEELLISLFAAAFTIGGIGSLALCRFRVSGIEKQKH